MARKMDEYVRIIAKNTEFFSTQDPDMLLDELLHYGEQKGYKFQAAEDKYKVKMEIVTESGETVEMKA